MGPEPVSVKTIAPEPGPAPLMEPPAVPVLTTFMTQSFTGTPVTPSRVPPAAEQVTELEGMDSVAGDADVPKIPKTNVAMATAAIRVIAISMTVARTGLIALRLDGILNFAYLPMEGRE